MKARIKTVAARLAPFIELKALQDPRWQRPILILAALGFVVGIFLSLRAEPDIFREIRWLPLALLALVAIPVTIGLNAIEFMLSAKLIGHRIGLRSATETTIIGGVANMLPLPGGTIVRIAALKSAGATLKSGTSTTVYVALLWFGVAFAYSGVWLAVLGQALLGAALVAAGLLLLAVCLLATRRLVASWRVTYELILAKAALVLIDAARIHLSLLAIGTASGFGQASALTVSSVLGASVSIVPAGLGIREGVAALMGPLIGLTPASAYLASSLNRIVGLLVSAPFAAALAMRLRNRSASNTAYAAEASPHRTDP